MKNISRTALGLKLRAIRKERGLTISEVGQLTGLASSTISKVENGQMSLTYDKLSQFATGLKIDMAALFGVNSTSLTTNSAMARRSVDNQKGRVHIRAGGYHYWYLNTALSRKAMTPMLGLTTFKSLKEFGDLIRHPGEEFVFVIEGKIAVHTEHYEPVVLNRGDSLYIDSAMGHAYIAAADGPCRFISVCTGDAEEAKLQLLKSNEATASTSATQPAQKPTGRKPR